MSNVGKGTKISDEVEPSPIPAGFWYGASCGYKDSKVCFALQKFSCVFCCFWWQVTAFFNSGFLDKRDRWVIGLIWEYFLTDWHNPKAARYITEKQKSKLDQMKMAIAKFISSGQDQTYTTKDPIRYWVSIMKYHKDAPRLNTSFFRELETMGPDPNYYMMETVLSPSDYDSQNPYHLEKWVPVNVAIGEIAAENQMHFMTRDEANEARARRTSTAPDVRRVVHDEPEQPHRESMGQVLRRRANITNGNQNPGNLNSSGASSSRNPPQLKRQNDPLTFDDTPPPKAKKQNDALTFT